MENEQNPQPAQGKKTNPVMWIIVLIVIIGLGVGAYLLLLDEDADNGNTNVVANTNTEVNENMNTARNNNVNMADNTNGVSNTNNDTNTNLNTNFSENNNTNTDNTERENYVDDEFGFTFTYPDDWKLYEYDNGTVSVTPLSFQEPIPLIKALSGNTTDMTNWMVQNWLDPEASSLVKTTKQHSIGDYLGDIYQIDSQDYAIIIELDNYCIGIRMNVLQREIPFTDYATEYQKIIESILI